MTSTIAALPVRDLEEGDVPGAFALCQVVGWPHREEDLRFLTGLGQGLVATGKEGSIKACAVRWSFGPAVGVIGLVIVSPDLQGRGVGRGLMQRLIDAAGQRRLHLHATEAGRGLYERQGFVAAGLVRQQQGVARPGLESGQASGVRVASSDDREVILALDTAATDADRTALLDGLAGIGRGYVRQEEGRVTGFAFLRPFGRGLLLGPVVAESREAGLALVLAGVDAGAGSFLRIDTPILDEAFRRDLAASGLSEVATALPMVRGGPASPAGPARVYGLAAQALG